MRFKSRVFLAGLLAAGLAGTVLAQTPTPAAPSVSQDAKCLALGSLMNLNNNNDAQTRSAGNILMMFYLGRLSAANKQVDLDRALQVTRDETKNGAGPLREECSAIFNAANGLLVAKPEDSAPTGTPPLPTGTTPAPSRTTPGPGGP